MRKPLSSRNVDFVLFVLTIFLGFLHAWMGRYSMNPDGMSYLDVGQSFYHHDWFNAVNAWWSPLYSWILGLVLGVFAPSLRWEFPVVHFVNFLIFLAALFAFRFLIHSLLAFRREQDSKTGVNGQSVGRLPYLPIAYAVFWWIALEVETVYEVAPDLAVVACICLSAGLLLRLHASDSFWKFALFGFTLAVGYWTKAILFPIAFVFLGASYFWKHSESSWRARVAVACCAFLVGSAPLVLLLSKQKRRFTFGDSGKVNYAWSVSPRTYERNWQGEEPESGMPMHPTRQLMKHPPLFEFDGPVAGTYPPWTDPSYWNEGLRWHFKIRRQVEVLVANSISEARLVIREQPALIAAIIILALLSGQSWWQEVKLMWPLVVVSIAGLAAFLPLIENDRYLGGFVLLLMLAMLFNSSWSRENEKVASYVLLAIFAVIGIGTADYTFRVLTHHLAPGRGPTSAWEDVLAAEELHRLGISPGDRVAVILDGSGAYWARLDKLHIVAEIMDAKQGSREFWSAPEEEKNKVYEALASTRAKVVVSTCPTCPPGISNGWLSLGTTPYCVRPLQVDIHPR